VKNKRKEDPYRNMFGFNTLFDTQLFVRPHIDRCGDLGIKYEIDKKGNLITNCPNCGNQIIMTSEALDLECNKCGWLSRWRRRIRVPKRHRSG